MKHGIYIPNKTISLLQTMIQSLIPDRAAQTLLHSVINQKTKDIHSGMQS